VAASHHDATLNNAASSYTTSVDSTLSSAAPSFALTAPDRNLMTATTTWRYGTGLGVARTHLPGAESVSFSSQVVARPCS